MNNNQFANLLMFAVDKKKINAGKLVNDFIDEHFEEKIDLTSFDTKGELTAEVIEFGKKLPKNTKIGLPELSDIVTRAKASAIKVADKVSTKRGYHASEW
jgi:hypothetical protein